MSRRWDDRPETEAERKFFKLRESGYRGPIDQDGNEAGCLVCGKRSCSREGFAGKCD